MIFTHYSNLKLDVLDPKYFGTSNMNGTELKNARLYKDIFTPRIYAYIGDSDKKEYRLGDYKHIGNISNVLDDVDIKSKYSAKARLWSRENGYSEYDTNVVYEKTLRLISKKYNAVTVKDCLVIFTKVAVSVVSLLLIFNI